jgi:tetratricopeptide (TPR) repeat protein
MERLTAEFAKFKEEIYIVQSDVKAAYYERAINKLHQLIVLNPSRAEPYYELGQLAYKLWNNEAALDYYQTALLADENYFPTYTGFAFILIKNQRFDEAEALLEISKNIISRDDSDIFFYLGMLNQHKGEVDLAINYYNKAIQHSINQSQIDLNLKFISACKELRGWS